MCKELIDSNKPVAEMQQDSAKNLQKTDHTNVL